MFCSDNCCEYQIGFCHKIILRRLAETTSDNNVLQSARAPIQTNYMRSSVFEPKHSTQFPFNFDFGVIETMHYSFKNLDIVWRWNCFAETTSQITHVLRNSWIVLAWIRLLNHTTIQARTSLWFVQYSTHSDGEEWTRQRLKHNEELAWFCHNVVNCNKKWNVSSVKFRLEKNAFWTSTFEIYAYFRVLAAKNIANIEYKSSKNSFKRKKDIFIKSI